MLHRYLIPALVVFALINTSCAASAVQEKADVMAPVATEEIPAQTAPVDPTEGWKTVTDRDTLQFKIPPTWRTQMRLVAPYTEYISGREYIGLFADADSTPDMRIDIYRRPFDKVRREHPQLNGTSGTLMKEDILILNDLPWHRLEYVDTSTGGLLRETTRVVYITERDGKTYHTGYIQGGDTRTPDAIVRSLRLLEQPYRE